MQSSLLHIQYTDTLSLYKNDQLEFPYTYMYYLRNHYQTQAFGSSTQWPPVPITRIFKLAMIQKENVQRRRIDDEFVTQTITGRVDDILQKKAPVCIEDIFTQCERRKLVLIEGAPGSGKSTLALHICQEWAEGKLFQEFDIAVLLRLRDPLIRKAKSIDDILPCKKSAVAHQVGPSIVNSDGKGVLWVLDGWDELPSDLPRDSILNKIIPLDSRSETLLNQSAVIVTSRPSPSAELHPLVSSRLEVLGFTPFELEQYFTECLQGDTESVQILLGKIRENPVVEGSCYLPLNASIVAHVFLSGDHSILTSNHAIFTSVVRFNLSLYMQNRLGVAPKKAMIRSLDTIPKRIRIVFRQLCKVAYYGVIENKVTFTADDFKLCGTSDKVAEIGLLQAVPSILVDNREFYYNFVHLTIQELLAAVHISHMSSTDQMAIFKKMFGHPRFTSVFKFYAKLTKLRAHRPLMSLLPKVIFPSSPRGILDLITEILMERRNLQIISLLHCLYEAEDTSLCVFVASRLGLKLDLSHTLLSPLDCLSIGYFLSLVCMSNMKGGFTVNLTDCCMSDQGCKFLVHGLRKCLYSHSRKSCKLDLLLLANSIGCDGAQFLAEILRSTNVLRKLDLSENELSNKGISLLCEALTVNTSVEVLYLKKCSLTIDEECGSAICQLLSRNVSLTFLNLSWNHITNCHHIAAGLANNKTLTTLHLSNCDLTDQSVQDLSKGLNNYIEELYIHGCNTIIEEHGMHILTNCVANLTALKHLWIPSTSMNHVFIEVNKERRKYGLSEIKVTCKCSCNINSCTYFHG